MRITSGQNQYDFHEYLLKQLRPVIVIMLKKMPCKSTPFEILCYSRNFLTTASRFFIIEPAFCEHDKNYKFDNSKTQNESLF